MDIRSLYPIKALASFAAVTLLAACGQNVSSSEISTYTDRATRFTVASYNAENLWDYDDSNSKAYTDFSNAGSNWIVDKMYAKKSSRLAEALRIAKLPDIVGLQEIESAGNQSKSLEMISGELTQLGYKYFAIGGQGNEVSVTTAVISKYPIIENRSIDFPGDESSRDPQVVTVDIKGTYLTLYVNHWKSARGNSPAQTENQRIAAATLVRADLNNLKAQFPDRDAVVLGDFNSDYNSNVTYRMKTGLVDVLKASGNLAEILRVGSTEKLYNLWFDLPEERRCSTSFDDRRHCIDNILLTDTLFNDNGIQYVPGSFHVVGHGAGEEALINADGSPFRWQIQQVPTSNGIYSHHTGFGFSDHLPIVGEFVVVPKTESRIISIQNPSTTEYGPANNPEFTPALCKYESSNNASDLDFSQNRAFQKCVTITNGKFVVQKLTRFDVGVQINGQYVMIAANGAYSRNKNFVRNVIQQMAGRHLKSISGRVGWNWGFPAIYIDSPNDIEFN